MAFESNNNTSKDQRPVSNVFSSINLANADSSLQATKLTIGYFNRLMQISIAPRNPASPGEEYPTFNNQSAVKVYISYSQAKMLHDAMVDMFQNPKTDKKNICVETKHGLFKISNGEEFGSNSPCVSIMYVDGALGKTVEAIYQMKNNYEVAYNYENGKFSTQKFPNLEVDILMVAFREYFNSANYAVASSIHEASMYRENYAQNILKSIANKVGAVQENTRTNSAPNSFSNHTFLSTPVEQPDDYKQNSPSTENQYQMSTFDDIVAGMNATGLANDKDK